jgi:hypothetical protein
VFNFNKIFIIFRRLLRHHPVGTSVALPQRQTTNPNKEGRKMRTDGHTVRENEMVAPQLNMESVKQWAKRALSKERSEAGIAKLVVLSYIGIVLAQIFLTY